MVGTGGGISAVSIESVGEPKRTECGGREEVGGVLIVGRLLLSNDMEALDGSPPGGRGGRAGEMSVVDGGDT